MDLYKKHKLTVYCEGYQILTADLFLFTFSPLWEMVQEGIDLKSIKWSQH